MCPHERNGGACWKDFCNQGSKLDYHSHEVVLGVNVMLYQGKRFQAFSDTLQELLSQDNGLLFHMTLPMFIKQCVRLFKAASTAYFTKNHKELKTGFNQGRIQGGGRSPHLKPMKAALFTMVLYNSEKIIRDIRPFFCPFLCHSGVLKCCTLHLS